MLRQKPYVTKFTCGLKFLQLVGILSEGEAVECGIHHKMHRRVGNLSDEKQTRKSLILIRAKQGEGYSLPAPQAEAPVIIITAVLCARLRPGYPIPDAPQVLHYR